MQNLHEAEHYYTPWLYDLAFLEQYFLKRKGLNSGYVVDIPIKDGYLSDIVPFPEILPTLIFTLSYLEKGLKFIALITTDNDYQIVFNKKHDLPEIFKLLPEVYKNNFCNFTKKEKLQFNKLLKIKYTKLRYLETHDKFNIKIDILENIIIKFKNEIIRLRNDYIYDNEAKRNDFINIQKLKSSIEISFRGKTSKIKNFEKSIFERKIKQSPKEEIQSLKELGFIKFDKYSANEISFIKKCYNLIEDQYLLKKDIKLRDSIKLIKLMNRDSFGFNNLLVTIKGRDSK